MEITNIQLVHKSICNLLTTLLKDSHVSKQSGLKKNSTQVLLSPDRDIGSISNLWEHETLRALFLKKQGAFSKNKKGTSLFTAKSWGHMPPVPPVSYVYVP